MPGSGRGWHKAAMLLDPFYVFPYGDPNRLSDREREEARWNPDRETLEMAAAGAARVLGEDHRATMALAKASLTMDKADLWQARLAVKNLRADQRQAITLAVEKAWEAEAV